jgi:hypothetical protein
VASTENPVVEMPETAGYRAAVAELVAVSMTNGTLGSVDPNVTVASVPVAALVPVPQVRDPRAIVEAEFSTGAGGVVPPPAPAAAVTVVESQGEYPHSAVLLPVAYSAWPCAALP